MGWSAHLPLVRGGGVSTELARWRCDLGRATARSIAGDNSEHYRAQQFAQCACDRLATVHCVVHYLGHCTWTLFMGTVKKKKYKNDPRNPGLCNVIVLCSYK